MPKDFNHPEIPASLRSNGPILAKLKSRKWFRKYRFSADRNDVINYLQDVEKKIPYWFTDVHETEKWCEHLLALFQALWQWKLNHGLEVETLEFETEFETLETDLKALLSRFANDSKHYTNQAWRVAKAEAYNPAQIGGKDPWDDIKEINQNLRTRIRHALRTYGNEADLPDNKRIGKPVHWTVKEVGKTAAKQVPGVKTAMEVADLATAHLAVRDLEQIKKDAMLKYPANASETSNACPCRPHGKSANSVREHEYVLNDVLHYLLEKKRKKRLEAAKTLAANLLPEEIAKARSYALLAYKTFLKGKDKNRLDACTRLTDHLLSCDCPLAQDLVATIFKSREKMEWLRLQGRDVVVGFLLQRIK